eukprot:COSAG05_NODE_8016_length_745_cov_1.122291_1_plen_241_part_10
MSEAPKAEAEEEGEAFDTIVDARAELQHVFALSFDDAQELVLFLCTLASDPATTDAETFMDSVSREGGGIDRNFCRRVYEAARFEGALRRRREQVASSPPPLSSTQPDASAAPTPPDASSAQAKYDALEAKFKDVERTIAAEREALNQQLGSPPRRSGSGIDATPSGDTHLPPTVTTVAPRLPLQVVEVEGAVRVYTPPDARGSPPRWRVANPPTCAQSEAQKGLGDSLPFDAATWLLGDV